MSSSPSPYSSHLFLLCVFSSLLLVLHHHLAIAVAADSAPAPSPSPPSNGSTIYDLLPHFGFPPGLLPNTVKSYSLADNGTFTIDLSGACYINFDPLVYYSPHITGVLRYGSIESLEGIQFRRFLIWRKVDAVKVDLPPADVIYFDVGLISHKLPVDQFRTIHSCRKNWTADIGNALPIAAGGDSEVAQIF